MCHPISRPSMVWPNLCYLWLDLISPFNAASCDLFNPQIWPIYHIYCSSLVYYTLPVTPPTARLGPGYISYASAQVPIYDLTISFLHHIQFLGPIMPYICSIRASWYVHQLLLSTSFPKSPDITQVPYPMSRLSLVSSIYATPKYQYSARTYTLICILLHHSHTSGLRHPVHLVLCLSLLSPGQTQDYQEKSTCLDFTRKMQTI